MTIMEQIKRDEGKRLKLYRCSAGKASIGYGRNLDDCGITEAEAEMLLQHDIERATSDLLTHLPWAIDLDDARRGVLLNMTFNMGIHGLLGFRNFLRHVQEGNFDQAAVDGLDSQWATQVGARAERLMRQLITGEWQ